MLKDYSPIRRLSHIIPCLRRPTLSWLTLQVQTISTVHHEYDHILKITNCTNSMKKSTLEFHTGILDPGDDTSTDPFPIQMRQTMEVISGIR